MTTAVPAPPLGQIVARNVATSFLARGLELALVMVTTPIIMAGLGRDQFGLLAIGQVLTAYLCLLDLGVGGGLSVHLAQQPDPTTRVRLIRSALALHVGSGLLATVVLTTLSGVFATRVFSIAGPLCSEARGVFLWLGAGMLITLLSSCFQCILVAEHRTYLMNVATLVGAVARHGGTTAVAVAGGTASDAALVFTCAATLQATILALYVVRLAGWDALRPVLERESVRSLLKFGSMASIAQVASLVAVQLDKLLIGFWRPISVLPFYTVPFALMGKVWELPRSVLAPTTPAFTQLHAAGERERLRLAYVGTSRFIVIASVHVCTSLIVFAPQALRLWLGAEFETNATSVLRLLASGVFLSVALSTPLTLATAINRPDISAKTHVILLVIQVGLLLSLVPRWGIEGAAVAWVAIHVVDVIILLPWVHRAAGIISVGEYILRVFPVPIVISVAVTVGAYLCRGVATTFALLLCLLAASYLAHLVVCFLFALDRAQRGRVRQVLGSLLSRRQLTPPESAT